MNYFQQFLLICITIIIFVIDFIKFFTQNVMSTLISTRSQNRESFVGIQYALNNEYIIAYNLYIYIFIYVCIHNMR